MTSQSKLIQAWLFCIGLASEESFAQEVLSVRQQCPECCGTRKNHLWFDQEPEMLHN